MHDPNSYYTHNFSYGTTKYSVICMLNCKANGQQLSLELQ